MVFDITQLKKIRKQLDLTQFQFANKAGISQSMVAKIEAGRLDPTYSYVKKIEQTLGLLTKHHEKEAKDIMNKLIISVGSDEQISNIIKLMTKHGISQVPVLEKGDLVGLISESTILQKEKNVKIAKEIMEELPPVIAKDAKIEVVKQLLGFYPIVFVKEKGRLIGLITKADLIKSLF